MRPSSVFRGICLFLFAVLLSGCGAKATDGCGVDAKGAPLTARLAIKGVDSVIATHSARLTTELTSGELVPPLTIEWTQPSGPKGTLETRSYGLEFGNVLFSAYAVGQVTIKAKVADANGRCVTAEKALTVTALDVTPLVFSDKYRNTAGSLVVPVMDYAVPADISTQWTQTAGPPVTLTLRDSLYYEGVDFTVPNELAPLSFVVKLFDKGVYFGTGSVTFTPINRQPQAWARANPDIPLKHQQVNLTGAASTDPENDPLRYRWRQVSGPAVDIIDANTMNASFIAPDQIIPLQFTLEVADPFGGIDVFPFTINLRNQLPVAQAGPNRVAPEGRRIQLDGSASSDPDNDRLTYTWTQDSGPSVQLTDATGPRPGFVAPEAGQALTFTLRVHDGDDASVETSTVIVAIKPDTLDQNSDGDALPDVVDVDADGDGLIEVFTLEQLFAIRNRHLTGAGCAVSQCNGFELTSDLDFDSNGDGVVDDQDHRYARYPDWQYYQVSAPFYDRVDAPFNFDGNGHSIRHFKGNFHGLFGRMQDTGPANPSGAVTDFFIRNLNLHGTAEVMYTTCMLLDSVELGRRKRLTVANVNLDIEYPSGGKAGFIAEARISDQSTLAIRDSSFKGQFSDSYGASGGGLIGLVYGESSLVEIRSSTAHFDAYVDSNSGGLIGHAILSESDLVIDGGFTSGRLIRNDWPGSLGTVGGLVGYIYSDYGHDTHARYLIRNSASTVDIVSQSHHIGGFIGGINAPSPFTHLVIERSFYAGQVSGIQSVGGLLGLAMVGAVEIRDSWVGGQAEGSGRYYDFGSLNIGGVAGGLHLFGSGLNVANLYSLAKVSGDAQTGALFGEIDNRNVSPEAALRVVRSYWARDSSGLAVAFGSELGTAVQDDSVALARAADLACAGYPGDSTCDGSSNLYEGWDLSVDGQGAPIWYFGNSNQFPGLRVLGEVYRPSHDAVTGLYFAVGE